MKTAVLGIGGMGKTVIQHLSGYAPVKGIYAYDIEPRQLGEAREKFPSIFCESLEKILSNPEIRLIFITASNAAHKDLALAAMRSGKAVMVEKPIASSLKDAEIVVTESERLKAFLQVGFELRYSTLYTTVKTWIDSGSLGKIINTHCNYICSEFHGKGSWRNCLRTGGSMFAEKLCHYVDLPRWWIGSKVDHIYCASAPNVVTYKEVHDNYHAVYRFKNGAVSHLTFMMYVAETFNGDPLQNCVSQQIDDGHELRFLVTGTQGAAETDVFRRRVRRWEFGDSPKGLISKLVEEHTWTEVEDHHYFHNTEEQTHDIIRRVLNGLPPKTSASDSLETMRLVEAAELSANDARLVSLDEMACAV